MPDARKLLLRWFEQGAIDSGRFEQALRAAGVLPSDRRWGQLLDRAVLAFGVIFLLSGAVTFFAANWQAMGRFGRFLLIDGLLIIALVGVWRWRLSTLAGQAALFAASVLVGVLLAVVGQTYQTGADTYELFAAWALLILPWALLAGFPPLWILWIGLINLAIYLYFDTFGLAFGFLDGARALLWLTVAVNAMLLVGFEWRSGSFAACGRWVQRVLATLCGMALTSLAVIAVVDTYRGALLDLVIWATGLATALGVYRYHRLDLYVLAGCMLSLTVVVVVMLSHSLIGNGGPDVLMFLIITFVIVAMSAFSGRWLSGLAAKDGEL